MRHSLVRSFVRVGALSCLLAGCGLDLDDLATGETSAKTSLQELVATCPTTGDAQSCLQAFLSSGSSTDVHVLPAGTYHHSGVLVLKGAVQGAGAGKTVLVGTTPSARALRMKGPGVSLSGVSVTSTTSSRLTNAESAAVWLDTDASSFEIANVEIYGKGGSGGIFAHGASNGKIHDVYVHETNADCIHSTNSAHDIEIFGNRVEHCGDDSYAVVGYSEASAPYRIDIHDNRATYQDWGRGYSCVGGHDVKIRHNFFEHSPGGLAGIYAAAEPAYGSTACHDAVIEENTVKDAGSTKSGHSAIMVWNGSSSPNLKNITIRNNVGYEPPVGKFIRLNGGAFSAADVANNVTYQDGGVAVSVETSVAGLVDVNNVVRPASAYPGDGAPTSGNPTPPPPTAPGADGCGVLVAGKTLLAGDRKASCDGRFSVVMQKDGNLVLYKGSTPLWSTKTWQTSGQRAVMQADGNFVLYDAAGKALFATGTWGHPGGYLKVQEDGNLVVHAPDGAALWASGTSGR